MWTAIMLVTGPIPNSRPYSTFTTAFAASFDEHTLSFCREFASAGAYRATRNWHSLANVITNLVNNSIKFTGEGGLIKVSFNHEAGESRICVHDNGIGIPYEMLDRLFRLDGNVKREGTDKEKGTGLGLIMCREYAGIMGGKLSVSSKQGEGASFCFTFPA